MSHILGGLEALAAAAADMNGNKARTGALDPALQGLGSPDTSSQAVFNMHLLNLLSRAYPAVAQMATSSQQTNQTQQMAQAHSALQSTHQSFPLDHQINNNSAIFNTHTANGQLPIPPLPLPLGLPTMTPIQQTRSGRISRPPLNPQLFDFWQSLAGFGGSQGNGPSGDQNMGDQNMNDTDANLTYGGNGVANGVPGGVGIHGSRQLQNTHNYAPSIENTRTALSQLAQAGRLDNLDLDAGDQNSQWNDQNDHLWTAETLAQAESSTTQQRSENNTAYPGNKQHPITFGARSGRGSKREISSTSDERTGDDHEVEEGQRPEDKRKRKGGGSRKEISEAQFELPPFPAPPSGPNSRKGMGKDEMLARRRARNRVAAVETRRKKKEKVGDLQNQLQQKEEQLFQLQARYNDLEARYNGLQRQLGGSTDQSMVATTSYLSNGFSDPHNASLQSHNGGQNLSGGHRAQEPLQNSTDTISLADVQLSSTTAHQFPTSFPFDPQAALTFDAFFNNFDMDMDAEDDADFVPPSSPRKDEDSDSESDDSEADEDDPGTPLVASRRSSRRNEQIKGDHRSKASSKDGKGFDGKDRNQNNHDVLVGDDEKVHGDEDEDEDGQEDEEEEEEDEDLFLPIVDVPIPTPKPDTHNQLTQEAMRALGVSSADEMSKMIRRILEVASGKADSEGGAGSGNGGDGFAGNLGAGMGLAAGVSGGGVDGGDAMEGLRRLMSLAEAQGVWGNGNTVEAGRPRVGSRK